MLRQLPRSTASMATACCHTFHLMAALNFASTTTTTTPEPLRLSLPRAASKSRIIQIKPILLNNVAQTKRQSFPTFRSTASSGRSYRATLPRAAAVDPVTIEERTIAVGDKLPDAELSYFDKSGNIQTIKVSDLTKGKKVIVFAVPGAFTPTCTQKHVPGFLEKAEELKAKGVDTIACVSVNDVFVMKAWGESLEVNDKILLLSDGAAEFTKALGVTLDLTGKPQGLGVRSRRYALLAEDGVVKILNLEEGGSFTVSSAQEILKAL